MATIRKHVTRDLVTVETTTPIRDAAGLMSERKIGSVALREGGRIAGIVTERDLITTVLARTGDVTVPVREALRSGLPRVSPDATDAEVAALMRDHYTRHLLVEEKGEVIGVVSMRDIIQLMLDEKQFVIEQLQTYIDGR